MFAEILPPKVHWLHPLYRMILPGSAAIFLSIYFIQPIRAQVCNDLVYLSLDASCTLVVTPDMVLEGSYNYGNCVVTLRTPAGVPVPNNLGVANIGATLIATVTDTTNGNSCSGEVKIGDHLPPVIACTDLELPCVLPGLSPAYLLNELNIATAYPGAQDNCSPVTLIYSDVTVNLGCDDPLGRTALVQRNWTASDNFGNTASCLQQIHLKRIKQADIQFPADYTTGCAAPQTGTAQAGSPYVVFSGNVFSLFPEGNGCGVTVSYTDQNLPLCDGAYKILRSWLVWDNCLLAGGPIPHIQVISVKDNEGPAFACPNNLVLTANPQSCSRHVDLPDVFLSDNCSFTASFSAQWQIDSTAILLNGLLQDFPGNNYWKPDTLGVLGIANNLPVGTHTLYYLASDGCGQQSTCSFTITIEDNVPPVAACDEYTQVNLGGTGTALIFAATFDDGSYDNCTPPTFKVRRLDANACQPNDMFYDAARFCCEDVGDTISVVLRVYDFKADTGAVGLQYGQPHHNDCQVNAIVRDKLKPACIAPPNVETDCEQFDPSLAEYGWPVTADNCCLDTSYMAGVDYTLFDTVCNRGTLIRTFHVTDCNGQSNQCTQRVVVDYDQFYYLKFPDDLLLTDCDTMGYYSPGPEIFGTDCERMSISYQDEKFETALDACVKIERTWKVINWCTYNPNLPLTVVPNPTPHPELNHVLNLPGPLVAPVGNTPASSVMRVNPDDPDLTDYSMFWSRDANGYLYKQIITIRDVVPPKIRSCPLIFPLTFCDKTENNPQFYNDPAWVINSMPGMTDLCEAQVELSVTADDACTGADILIRYLLFLDLDNNDTVETVVSSTNPPGYNTVRFGNINTYNYEGGEPRQFDQRPVPPDQKYGFTIQTTMSTTKTARLRWNTAANPNSYVWPQLPYGKHIIRWIVSDACGNESTCEYHLTVKDCLGPTVVCLNGLSVNVQANSEVTIYAGDLLNYFHDNCTPTDQLQMSLIKIADTTGMFPLNPYGLPNNSINFNCDEIGTQVVQLWARDNVGNAGYCETYVQVQDNLGMCANQPVTVSGSLATETNQGVQDAEVTLSANPPALPPLSLSQLSDPQGNFSFNNSLPFGSEYAVTPYKNDNFLNGLTTFDLVQINKHILGQEPLDSPYKMIAADANHSGSITSFDVLELRKLILGINNELPLNTSWRFIDRLFVFPNPLNPFETPFPETIQVHDVQHTPTSDDFVAVKIGDVNNSALPNGNALHPDDRAAATLFLDVEDRYLQAGETIRVPVTAGQDALACQFTLSATGMAILEIQPGANMETGDFALWETAASLAWASSRKPEKPGFSLLLSAGEEGWLHEMLSLSGSITPVSAYINDSGGTATQAGVGLRFNRGNNRMVARQEFELYQNTPNPFQETTLIRFYLPEATEAEFAVIDATGRVLYRNKGQYAQGYNALTLNRGDITGSGVVFYRLTSPFGQATRLMKVE